MIPQRFVDRMRRRWCRFVGCRDTGHEPACFRCGEWYYDGFIFQHEAKIWPVIEAMRWLGSLPRRCVRKCEVCNTRMWFSGTERCCSSECFEKWITF